MKVVLPFQILCVIMPFKGIGALYSPALTAIGKPQVSFWNVVIGAVLMPLAFLLGVRWGIIGICVTWCFGYPILLIIISYRSLKHLGLSIKEFFSGIMASFTGSMVMFVAVAAMRNSMLSEMSPIPKGSITIISGIGIYVMLTLLYNRETVYEVVELFSRKKDND